MVLELVDAEQLRLDGQLIRSDRGRAPPCVAVLGFISTRSPATRAQHFNTALEYHRLPIRVRSTLASPERHQRPFAFRLPLALAGAGPPGEIPTDVRAGRVHAANEARRLGLNAQGATVTVDHTHVGTISVEPDQLLRAFGEPPVIVPGNSHVGEQPGKAARAAHQALGDDGQT